MIINGMGMSISWHGNEHTLAWEWAYLGMGMSIPWHGNEHTLAWEWGYLGMGMSKPWHGNEHTLAWEWAYLAMGMTIPFFYIMLQKIIVILFFCAGFVVVAVFVPTPLHTNYTNSTIPVTVMSSLRRALCQSIRLIRPTYWQMTLTRSLPVCTVQTSQTRSALPKDFIQGLSQVLAETLGKDEAVGRFACACSPYLSILTINYDSSFL